MGGSYFRRATVSLREQRNWIITVHPGFSCKIKGGLLVCGGDVRPTPLNHCYRVRVEYRTRKTPRVYVESPKLRRRDPKKPIPHTYSDDEPCIFYPTEWYSDMKLALTVLPWLSMWLFYYEVWLATGGWHGGGVHPDKRVPGRLSFDRTYE